MKNGNSGRRSGTGSRNQRRSFNKQLSRVMDDENTTNSETSEDAEVLDINLEDNLEVDNTEVDEFAPKALPKATRASESVCSVKKVEESKPVSVKPLSTTPEYELSDVESPADFHIDLKLLILNYKTNEWVEGVVEEIDYEEDEVLIRHVSGDNAEEWISMKSHRIKKKRPLPPMLLSSVPETLVKEVKEEIKVEPSSGVDTKNSFVSAPVAKTATLPLPVPPTPITRSSTSSRRRRSNPPVKKRLSLRKMKRAIKKPTFKKSVALSSKINQRRQLQVGGKINRLPVWKSHAQVSVDSKSEKPPINPSCVFSKFSESEKVLAKWSDHRMQKFPAVIKKVVGGGLYDVLFYDGFEKTITEDNLYKTTDEEMEKYQESKPSEADSFIDVDITSKHERRQKKRKTFDDFFEEKDFKRPKKIEGYDLNRSESFLRASLSRNKPNIQSFSVHNSKKFAPVTPKSSVVSTPKSVIVSPPKSSVVSTPKSSVPSTPNKSSVSTPKSIVSTPKSSTCSTTKSLQTPILTTNLCKENEEEPSTINKRPSPSVPLSTVTPNIPSTGKISEDGAKSKSPLSTEDLSKHPLEITCHDGVVRKSILIEDVNLPPGWTKHVIAWVDNVWACFLFTPDKYAVHSLIELKKYFRMTDGQEPPEGLDFSFPKDSLPELANHQKDLKSHSNYRKWVNKILDERKVTKKVRILPPSRSLGPASHFANKRVRTLLPRYRSHTFNQGGSGKTFEGKVWRCPKSDCAKKFRKENLLQMHIKHYHRELSDLAVCAPNVAELASARTSADGVFTSEPILKRSVPKCPIRDHPLIDKNSEIVSSEPEVKVAVKTQLPGGSSTPTSTSITELKSSLIPQLSPNTLKVLNPVKHSKNRSEGEIDVVSKDLDTGFSEKSRAHSTPKTSSRKVNDLKSLDDSGFLAGSRSFKKKQQLLSDINEPFFEDEFKEDDVVIERLQSEEIINCICGFKEEDGLMVQCEICLCWQHGACHGMEKDADVPEPYVCTVCLNPVNVRSSQKYTYANHYLTVSKLPRFSRRTFKEDVLHHRERILRKSFELTSNLQSMHKMERALTAKINIAQQSDHPKLYLWSANWDSTRKKQTYLSLKKAGSDMADKEGRGPVGEAPIESIDCRLRLLDRIEADQQDMESRLTIIQAQLQALESEDFDVGGEEVEGNNGDPLLKQAVYMLLRDLSTIASATSLS